MTPKTALCYRLLLLMMAYFTVGTASLAVVGLVPLMAEDLAVEPAKITHLVTIFALIFALCAPLMQLLFGHLSHRYLLLAGLLLLAIANFATAFSDAYSSIFFQRIIMALGASVIGPSASSIATTLAPAKRQGGALAIVFAGITLASVLGVPMATWIGDQQHWQQVFLLLGLMTTAIAILIAIGIPNTPATKGAGLQGLIALFRHRAVCYATGTTALQMGAIFVTHSWISIYLLEKTGTDLKTLAIALFVFGIGGVIGNIIAAKMADRIPANRLVLLSLLLLMGSFIALAALSQDIILLTGILGIQGAVAMLFHPSQQQRIIALQPQQRHMLLALNASAIYLGMSAGALGGNSVVALWGLSGLPLFSIAILLLALLTHQLSRRTGRL